MQKFERKPLEDAYLRAHRARLRLNGFRRRVRRFERAEFDAAEIKLFPEPNVPFQFGRPDNPIPRNYPIAIGEIIYNLRAALDYLVFDLAAFDSGIEQNGTQFPIEDTEQGFRRHMKTYLRGINSGHIASIERLQPYNGCEWTKRFRSLSNPDKHRRLTHATHNTGLTAEINPADSPFPKGGTNIKLEISIFISFQDGTPIIQTLNEFVKQVTNTLGTFKPDFD